MRASTETWSVSRQNCVLVGGPRGYGGIEQLPALHPTVRALEHLPGVGLEDDPLPGAEAPDIDALAEIFGDLAQPVMLVALRLEVDLALGAPQRGEVALQVLAVGVLAHQRPHDERGVDQLAKAELLEQVVLRAEHVRRLDLGLAHQT